MWPPLAPDEFTVEDGWRVGRGDEAISNTASIETFFDFLVFVGVLVESFKALGTGLIFCIFVLR